MTARRVVAAVLAAVAVGWVAGWVVDVLAAHRVCAAHARLTRPRSGPPANLVRLPERGVRR